jgi:heavy metal sensor kinase
VRTLFRRTRVRLTAAVATVFGVVAAVGAVALWFTFAHLQYVAIDGSLSTQARSLRSVLEDAPGRATVHGGDALPDRTAEGIAVGAILLDSRGTVLDRAGAAPMPLAVRGAVDTVLRTGKPVTATISDNGQPVRVLAQSVDLGHGSRGALLVTRPIQELMAMLLLLGLLLSAIVGVLTAVVSVLGYKLAGRALGPVRIIATTARELSEHDLHRRISLDLPPDELGELAATFNGMLERLDAAFTALRQFTADAAHELRAPLGLLRAELEVSLSRARTPDEYQATQRIALAEVERLGTLAEQLLVLARADAGALQPAFDEVDVGDLIEETVERWKPLAHARQIEIAVDIVDEGTAAADWLLLRRLIDNLLDNAVRHTPCGGKVEISVTRSAESWVIAVSDNGPGIAENLRPILFERFTRGDAARGRQTGGAGLGLALCRAIAEAHGGTISLEENRRAGARFLVQIPRSASDRVPVFAGGSP